jgi:6-phosphogluconolactonase
MKYRFTFFLLLINLVSFAQNEHYLLIGTYTSGKSEGIYVYKFNSENADNSFVSSVHTSNPSFLAVSPDQKFVYAVNEDGGGKIFPEGGAVTSFSFDTGKGLLTEINSRFSGGKDPCYISTDKTGKWLFTGNYSSGTVGLYSISKNGSIGTLKQLIKHNGSGPDTSRQRSAHVHSTVLSNDQQYLYVPDLGIDKVMIYRFNSKKGILTAAPTPFVKSVPGSGPRHFETDHANKYAYLMEELSGTVSVFKILPGKLQPIQRISALSKDFKGLIGSADIHVSPDGKYLYCSNRGESNSISIFSIDKVNGKLTLIAEQSTLGVQPRNFNFDPSGNFLLVANQHTDEIVIFSINKHSGLLTDTNKRINVPSPVCIKWIR